MVRIAIRQAAFDARSLLALLMILLAAPACAGSRSGGGVQGGGFPAFHPGGVRVLGFFGGYLCGYNCGLGLYGAGYGYGYGYDYGYGNGNGYGYNNGAGNAASISNGLTGGYVPDPVGADIPALIIPKNCWVRRTAYDPSGAYFGQVLINLCRPSDSMTVTGLRPRPKMPDTGPGTAQPPPVYRSDAPKSPQ
jgi:hypothetical protein